MNAADRQTLHAFVDDELDLAQRLAFEARLRDDAQLRETVDGLRQLRRKVREDALHHEMPDALRSRLTRLVEAPRHRPWWRRWNLRALTVSTALALSMLVGVDLAWLHTTADRRLGDEVVASHVRSTLAQHLTDVASSDHHTVKPWLSSRLDFSPPVPDLTLPGSVFVGGRVDYLDGRPVAALVYRQGEHVVTSFVWPGDSRRTAPDFLNQRGFQLAHWSQSGMNHWVISDVNRQEFEAVVRAMQIVE